MKAHEASTQEEEFFQAFLKLPQLRTLEPIRQVAIVSNLLGKMIALQDQRVYTLDQVMEIVRENIELGNHQILSKLINTEGTA